jgi:sortase A
MAVGRVVLVGGVLVLLFIPYLLWGTGLITARHQSALRTEFSQAQRTAGSTPVTLPPHPPAGTSGGVPRAARRQADPPLGSPVGTITIPSIGVSMVIVEGTGDAQLAAGPGHYPNTPLPGEVGNAAIAGHRTTYLHPFYDLNELVLGDPITIVTLQGVFLYHVTSSQSVLPSDVSVVDQTLTPTLTLTTCTPRYSASQRLVVHARLVASILAGHTKKAPARAGSAGAGGAAPSVATVPSTATRDWTAAILWGVAVAALITGLWIGARRTRKGQKVALITGGSLVGLAVVFFFFQAVAPLLPASY